MSRVNLGNSDQYIEQAKATTWNINVGSFDVSNAISSLEFEDAISQPGNFTLDLVVDPGDINGGEQVTIDKEEVGAFNGVVTQPERSSQRDDTIKGGGAAELLSGIPINGEFLATNTQSVVNNIFSQLNTTAIEVGVNEELSDGTGNVDVRAEDEGALRLLNRVVLSHGGEWYVSYDSVNDVYKFNVETKVENTTSKSFGDEAIKELRDVQVIDEEYDAVVVKGYGDGDDQIVGEYPARNNWPSDPEILRYTDKTILSQEEADSTAESVYNEHTEWRNIYLYPANENELLSLGDQVEINDSATGVNSTFRVVHRKLTITYSSEAEIEYVLSDRPIGVLDEGEDIRDQTDSETDYSQGSRNTINESNEDVSDKDNGTKVEFNIPDKFTEDIKNKDQTKGVFLDFSVDDYKQLIKASNADAVNDETSAVPTEVSNFGDVETQFSKERPSATSDLNKENTAGFQNVVGGGQSQGLSYTADDGNFVEGAQFTTDDTDIEGIYISVSLISNDENIETQVDPAQDEALYIRPTDIDGDGDLEDVYLATDDGDSETFLTESDVLNDDEDRRDVLVPGESKNGNNSTEVISFYAEVNDTTIYPNDGAGQGLDIKDWTSMGGHGELTADFDLFIPGNKKNSKVELKFANLTFGTSGSADGEGWTGFYTYYTVEKIQTPNADNSNDNVQAYVADSTGSGATDYTNLDASVNSNQNNQQLVNTNTTTFGQLDDNDLVLNRKTSTADQVRILLNGTEIDGSPYSLDTSNNPPYKQGDIELTGDSSATLNKPGFNTVEIRPENSTDANDGAKSYVKGNVIVDHKIESERE